MRGPNAVNRIFLSALTLFFAGAGMTAAQTYLDVLFLSTYPVSWLSYLFFGKTALLVVLTFVISPIVTRGTKLANALVIAATGVSVVVAHGFVAQQITGFAFGLSLWMDAVTVLISVIAWNAVNDAFDIREFKRISRWLYSAAGFGGLAQGVSTRSIIELLGADAMLFLLAAFLVIISVGVLKLERIAVSRRDQKQQSHPARYPLFIYTMLAMGLMILVDTLADYALKSEVGVAFSKDEIGSFMGLFYGVTSALTLLAQFVGAPAVLKTMGIRGLLSALPLFALAFGVALYVLPGLWAAALFRLGELVLRRSVDNNGRVLAANPLPTQVRRFSRLFSKGVATPVGTGLGGIALLVCPQEAGLQGIGLIVLAASAAWLLLNVRILSSYRTTLEEAVRTTRFGDITDEVGRTTPQMVQSVAARALREKDEQSIMLGFELLEGLDAVHTPPETYLHLASTSLEVRLAAIKAIGRTGNAEAISELVQRLGKEQEPEALWHLLERIAALRPERALEQARTLLDSHHPRVCAGAVLVMLAAGDLDDLILAATVLKQMVANQDPQVRGGAASALGAFPVGRLKRALQGLLQDPDAHVCAHAFRAVVARGERDLLPDVARQLGRRHVSLYASHTLLLFGEQTVPIIMAAVDRSSLEACIAAARTLARLPGGEAEDMLVELAEYGAPPLRDVIARALAVRARRNPMPEKIREWAGQSVLGEVRDIGFLTSAHAVESYSEWVKDEIAVRIVQAKTRLLYWYAVATEPGPVLDALPFLISARDISAMVMDRAKALELLETVSSGDDLKRALSVLEEHPGQVVSASESALARVNDPWLDWVLNTQHSPREDHTMDTAQKIIVLRKTSLFKELSGEVLLAVAEVTEHREVSAGDVMFKAGSAPDGLYIIASGYVNLSRDGEVIAMLKKHDILGEIGLIANAPRMFDAIVAADGMLFYIDQETFDNLTEDVPEVLRILARNVIGYLNASMSEAEEELHTVFMGTKSPLHRKETPPQSPVEISPFSETPLLGGTVTAKPKDKEGRAATSAATSFKRIAKGESIQVSCEGQSVVSLRLATQLFSLRLGDNAILSDANGVEYPIALGESVIGRDDACDIVVDKAFNDVSRQHAAFSYQGGNRILFTNLSTNGAAVQRNALLAAQ